MKITKNLTHVITPIELEAAIDEPSLLSILDHAGIEGYAAELDIEERTEDHVQMISLARLLDLAKKAGNGFVAYDITYFPHADEREVKHQLEQLSRDLGLSASVIREICEKQIEEYLELDAKRDSEAPVHTIVEAYVQGTAFAWYGMNDYPRLKKIILTELVEGGKKVEEAFISRAVEAQVGYEGFGAVEE